MLVPQVSPHFGSQISFQLIFSCLFFFFFIISYCKVLEQKEELEQKHLHLLQILDSERQAKWHYVQQTEELACEVKKLKDEVSKGFSFSLRECYVHLGCVNWLNLSRREPQ